MKFFLLRTGSALAISIVAGLLMLGALALAPAPAHATAMSVPAKAACIVKACLE